jgi:zinc and cadmium transporter
MQPWGLLAIYCLACFAASLGGGWVPLVIRLTHRRMQIGISFVSGMMLGIGLLHLLPHSYEALGSIDGAVVWLLAGFLCMFFLQRFFNFHQHEPPAIASSAEDHIPLGQHAHGPHHDHEPHAAHNHAHHGAQASFTWTGAVIGLSLHSLVDGVAMAASVWTEAEEGLTGWLGLGAALAVALHKPFDSLSIGALLAAAHKSPSTRRTFNFFYALVTPLGAIAASFLLHEHNDAAAGMGQALGFAAGAFLCIAASDLLPELQFHRHDRVGLSAALLLGIGLAWGTMFLEGEDHHHSGQHPRQPSHEQHDHEDNK